MPKKQETATNKKVTKTEKVETAVAVKPATKSASKTTAFSVPLFSLAGKEAGSMDLPKAIFGAEVNKALLAQALRVYLNNQKGHFSNTKTRGEVEGSTRKIYAQKGTGRARHGGIRAPIFVGGGIALGPKSRTVTLELPKKMKKASLISSLSQKFSDKQIFGISGLDKATGKTSEIAKFLKNTKMKSVLIVTGSASDSAQRAAANIKSVNLIPALELNTLEVIKAQSLIFTKEAVEALEKKVSIKTEKTAETKELKK